MYLVINGIDILSKTEIRDIHILEFVGLMLVSLVLTFGLMFWLDNRCGVDEIPPIFPVMLFIGMIVLNGKLSSYKTGEYEYKVTISDEVSMNEFMKKYEIINQEGKIYTIKER